MLLNNAEQPLRQWTYVSKQLTHNRYHPKNVKKVERVPSMSRSGISGFLPPKDKSQQLSLFEYFKIADCGTRRSKKWGIYL